MAGEESFPNFDWLKQGNAGQGGKPKSTQPAGPNFSAPPPTAEQEPEESEQPLDADSGSLLEDDNEIPPLVPNSSDGSTLILRNPDEYEDQADSLVAESFDVPPPEEDHLETEHQASESVDETTASQEAEPVMTGDDVSGDVVGDSTEAQVEAEPIASDEQAEPESLSESQQEPQPVPFERDTDAVGPGKRTSEYPLGLGGSPDFASGLIGIPAAAASVAAISRAPRPDSDPLPKSDTPRPTAPKTAASAGGGSKKLMLLSCYAVAVTLAFLLLLIKEANETFRPHHLESLPDIPAEKIENLSYVPANMKLPDGHSIPLGDHRRFGNILVEPLRITREPVQFVHYTGDAKRTKSETAPTWKLWVKLTNVSDTQTIAPFDRQLMLRWVPKAKQKWDYSNQYITYQGADSRSAPMVQLYRLPPQGDWDMKGQDLGKALKPGESYVTYLASSDEGLDEMGNKLVWRVQMRKGYSRKGHGVTTMFEVPFLKDEIES